MSLVKDIIRDPLNIRPWAVKLIEDTAERVMLGTEVEEWELRSRNLEKIKSEKFVEMALSIPQGTEIEDIPAQFIQDWRADLLISPYARQEHARNLIRYGMTCPYCDTADILPIKSDVPGAPTTCPRCGGWL